MPHYLVRDRVFDRLELVAPLRQLEQPALALEQDLDDEFVEEDPSFDEEAIEEIGIVV